MIRYSKIDNLSAFHLKISSTKPGDIDVVALFMIYDGENIPQHNQPAW